MSLHNDIMNLQCSHESTTQEYSDRRHAYIFGFRDARHAAAELAATHASQQAAVVAGLVGALEAVISECEYIGRDGWMTGNVHGDDWSRAKAVLAAYHAMKEKT